MSFRQLVEGECGNSNSLVRLSTVLSRDGTLNPQIAGPSSRADQFVHEFANQNAPQSFQMNALLENVREMEGAIETNAWSKEFKRFQPKPLQHLQPTTNHGWGANPGTFMSRTMTSRFPIYQNFSQARNIEIQYLDDESITEKQPTLRDEDIARKAKEKSKDILNAVEKEDVDQAYSQFMSFMRQVSGEDVSLGMQGLSSTLEKDDLIDKMAETYKEEWSKLSDMEDMAWSPHQEINPFTEYSFTEKNIMLDNIDALSIGKEKLRDGDVPGAVLCFEAAVKQQPELAEAWLLLGKSQAENEQDPQAIPALNKCIQINPSCLDAYMALSASYTNENYSNSAFNALLSWMKANPKYADLVPADVNTSDMDGLRLSEYTQDLFIKAAQMNPANVDPDIQAALGVIFNIKREYDKAIDCFKTALMVKSDDSHLWNRLGATLANGERSEEAVDAYQRALSLEPGFIRARYNVGITCMNLSAYTEAAEHFLTALNQQDKARGVDATSSNSNVLSSTIWSTLRMVCAFMNRHDLQEFIEARNLPELNKQFGL